MKSKSEIQGEEMKKFEEQTLTATKNMFEKYYYALDSSGLVLDIDLCWCNRGDKVPSYTRLEYSETYMCFLEIIVREKGSSQYDLDNESVCNIFPISQCSRSLWRLGIKFSKVPHKHYNKFIEKARKVIERVIMKDIMLSLKN